MKGRRWFDFNDTPDQTDYVQSGLDAQALKERLLTRLPEVLVYLFPNGKIRGKQFFVGDIHGSPGKSLVVELEGPRAGMWIDHADTAYRGDIFALWADAKGWSVQLEFAQVLHSIAEWLVIPPRLSLLDIAERSGRNAAPVDDLGPHTDKWDYRDGEGNLIACVYRYETESGKEFRPWDVKRRVRKAPEMRPLYNQPQIKNADTVVLVEGEKCADTLLAQGIVATTAMNGANAPVDKTDWSPLAGKHVIVWPDKDKVGWEYAESVLAVLRVSGVVSVALITPPDDRPEKWDAADAVKEGFDVETLIDNATLVYASNHARTLQLSDWIARERFVGEPPRREWLVEGIFPMSQAALIAASGGVGKSYLLLHLAREIAAYDGFSLNAPTVFGGVLKKSGAAVYITAEDDAIEIHNRLSHLGDIPKNLYAVPLPDAGGAQQLFAIDTHTRSATTTPAWASLVEQLRQIEDLTLIAIDPLQPLCGLDLNMPENTQFVCSQLSALAAVTKASVIISHHYAKKEASTPEQAREAIRGSGGLVDGVRAVYAFWYPEEKYAEDVCRRLNEPFRRGGVVLGGIVKTNGGADLQITIFVREPCGLLRSRNAELSNRSDTERGLLPDLKVAIAKAAVAGKPYTKTGLNGVYERRFEFPEMFHNVGKHKLAKWVDQLLAEGELVTAMAQGSKLVKWLDIPTGPVALGDADFLVGHIQRTESPRQKKCRNVESK